MDNNYTITNSKQDKLSVSKEFVMSCNVFKNLFEDLGTNSNEESLPITDTFDFEIVKEFANFFDTLYKLSIKNESEEEMSFVDYLDKYYDEIAKNYFHKNISFPLSNKLVNLYRIYKGKNDMFTKFLNINTFFDNETITKAICICIGCFIRDIENENEKAKKEEREDVDNMIETICDIMQQEQEKEHKKSIELN